MKALYSIGLFLFRLLPILVKLAIIALVFYSLMGCSVFRRKTDNEKLEDFLRKHPSYVQTDSVKDNYTIKIGETRIDSNFSVNTLRLKPVLLDNARMNVRIRYVTDSVINVEARSKGIDTTITIVKTVHDFSNFQSQAQLALSKTKFVLWFIVGFIGVFLLIIILAIWLLYKLFRKTYA